MSLFNSARRRLRRLPIYSAVNTPAKLSYSIHTRRLLQSEPTTCRVALTKLLTINKTLHAADKRRCMHNSKASDRVGEILCSLSAVRTNEDSKIATVTISNPKRLNSLNSTMIVSLTSTLESLAKEPHVRCVIIKGGPTTTKTPSFSSGANIYEMAALDNYTDANNFISQLHAACQAMRDIPVPTVASIDGLCLGGGLELAASCDFRFATCTSTFGMPETKYGIPSVIEARLLANIIGWQKTKEMVYLAKLYSAGEVEKWGLVDASCETVRELDEKVGEVVGTIAEYGVETMRAQKRLCRVWEEGDLVAGIEAGVEAFAGMFRDGGEEPKRYMKAFMERKG